MREDSSSFAAQAVNPQFGSEPVEGRIFLDRTHLYFQAPQASLQIRLPQLQVDLSELESGRVCFRDEQAPEWEIYTFETAVLESGPLRQQTHTRLQIRAFKSQGELKRRLKVVLYFLAGFAALALVVTLLTGIMVRSLVARIPVQWEQQLGDEVMAELKEEVVIIQDRALQAKLDRAVTPLLKSFPTNGIKYTFYLVQHPLPNAFALPGGHVLVHTSLIELADRPEEIAGVVAHEVAHVTQKHGFRKIISAAGPYLIFRLFAGGGGGLLSVLGGGSELLVQQSFSQEYELEADAVGWQYLVAAHIDPRGLPDMLRKLKSVHDHVFHGAVEFGAFSSHPPTAKRIRRLEEKWKHLNDKSGFIDFGPEPGR